MSDTVEAPQRSGDRRLPFPKTLEVRCESRWPTVLPESSRREILNAPIPRRASAPPGTARWASVIVPTLNREEMSRLCLGSVLAASGRRPVELIVVDNGSTDGTRAYLRELAAGHPQVKLIFNESNAGFAAANNQAVERSSGELLVFLNNDTIVPPGWMERLARRLEDRDVGLAGCLTNRSGGENEIDADYGTYGEFLEFARRVAGGSHGADFDCDMLPLCCAALRRETFDRIGPLDEGYGVGLFEDDDFCLRLRRAGFRIVVAADCYIHHFGQASMGAPADYAALMERNRERFERKWGVSWRPRERRRSLPYRKSVQRLRRIVRESVPAGCTVAVISRGDDELLHLDGVRGEHFMQDESGAYWGAHPADGDEAIARWGRLCERGADYLLIPETSSWWFLFYETFRQFVEQSFELVANEPEAGRLYRFRGGPSGPSVGEAGKP